MAWTVSEIVAEVSKRTENRAANKMDLRMEFFLALDKLCNEQHFWWKKKRGTLTTAIGVNNYDLSKNTPDFVELDEVLLINPDGVTVAGQLQHITTPGQQLEMILNNIQDIPSACFIDVQTSLQTLFLQAPSSVAQNIVYTYWAMPMVHDINQDSIPLLPAWLHWGLIPALERRVYLVLYGIEDPRYETTTQEYEEFLEAANNTPNWSGKKVQEARTDSRYMRVVTAHGPGIRG